MSMKETIVTAMLCAVLAGMAVLWRPAGDKVPRPEFAGSAMARSEQEESNERNTGNRSA